MEVLRREVAERDPRVLWRFVEVARRDPVGAEGRVEVPVAVDGADRR